MNGHTDILAIESSCDETSAAVVRDGREVLSNEIYTQIAMHTVYGGVVPELASRKHIEKINTVVRKALSDAGKTLKDIDAVAVLWSGTRAPAVCGGSKSHCLAADKRS
jgi:N6-L-threonylcarbamoyladenine synthase